MTSGICSSVRTSFTVRQADSRDDLEWVIQSVKANGRAASSDDAEIFHASGLTSSFFIGEKDGERISAVAFIKLNSFFLAVSYYFVVESHRGKGYGLRTWEHAWEVSEASEYTLALQVARGSSSEKLYEKQGCHTAWQHATYFVPLLDIKETLSHFTVPEGITIQPGSAADFSALAAYDQRVCGTRRRFLMENIMKSAPVSFVAVNGKSEVVGFIAVLKIERLGTEEHFAHPFLAESTSVATALLKSSVPALANLESKSLNLCFNIPNISCQKVVTFFVDTIKAKEIQVESIGFMFSGDPPKIAHTQQYSGQTYFGP